MRGLNQVTICGRLGKDPEVKSVNGNTVTSLTVATSESWVKNGEKQERTEWHKVQVWGKMAESCAKYLTKGSVVLVEGKLQTRSWESEGTKKYMTEIQARNVTFISTSKKDGESSPKQKGKDSKKKGNDDEFLFEDFGPEPDFDPSDDIPF